MACAAALLFAQDARSGGEAVIPQPDAPPSGAMLAPSPDPPTSTAPAHAVDNRPQSSRQPASRPARAVVAPVPARATAPRQRPPAPPPARKKRPQRTARAETEKRLRQPVRGSRPRDAVRPQVAVVRERVDEPFVDRRLLVLAAGLLVLAAVGGGLVATAAWRLREARP